MLYLIIIAAFLGSYSHILVYIYEGKNDYLLYSMVQSIVDDIRNFCVNKQNLSVIKRFAGDENSSCYVIITDKAQIKYGELIEKRFVFTGLCKNFQEKKQKNWWKVWD